MNTITFDRPMLDSLKLEYSKAVNNGRESFTFQGNKLLTSYAKYLIQYLEIKLKK
jgi:hypothetical protein